MIFCRAHQRDQIGSYVPFYRDAVQQVTTAVATSKTVVSAMGQQELAAKLEAMNETAEKLSTLMETTEAEVLAVFVL
eukprot:symbB.v1.2.036814.t1/scaffold5285.1/size28895/1